MPAFLCFRGPTNPTNPPFPNCLHHAASHRQGKVRSCTCLALHVAGHCTASATQCPRCGRLSAGCGRCLWAFRHPATHWFPCFLTVPWLLNHRAYLAGGGAGAGATTGTMCWCSMALVSPSCRACSWLTTDVGVLVNHLVGSSTRYCASTGGDGQGGRGGSTAGGLG